MKRSVQVLHEPSQPSPWVVRWWGPPDEHGRQKRLGKRFRHHREAKLFAIDLRAELERGRPGASPSLVTLGNLIAQFEQTRLRGLSYASQEGYRHTTRQLEEFFGHDRLLRDIDRRQAEAFISSRVRLDGRPGELSSWSRARIVINARAIWQAAVSWGYEESNPFQTAEGEGASALRIKPKARSWHYLTPTEFHRFLKVVESPRLRAVYWLLYSGLRPGEAVNLTIDRIDLERRRVHIANRAAAPDTPPFNIKAEGQSTESKERWVPIPEAALPDLTAAMGLAFQSGGFIALTAERFQRVQEQWRLCREGKPWGGRAAWRPWMPRDLLNNLLRDTKRYLARAGIEFSAPFNLYAFRKSYAQNLADAGTPARTLARLLGHADTRVTLQHYQRCTDANEAAAAATMDRLFAQKEEACTRKAQG